MGDAAISVQTNATDSMPITRCVSARTCDRATCSLSGQSTFGTNGTTGAQEGHRGRARFAATLPLPQTLRVL